MNKISSITLIIVLLSLFSFVFLLNYQSLYNNYVYAFKPSNAPNANETTSITSKSENVTIDLVQESTIIQRDPLRFSTQISIDAPANILSDIERVEYYLHPTFTPNIMTSFTKENNFGITLTNWGIFNLKAKVYFKNGTVQDLELPIEMWKLPT